jgi:hypothetical protein
MREIRRRHMRRYHVRPLRRIAALLAAPVLATGLIAAPLGSAAAAPVAAAPAAGSFEPVHAQRVLDTRSGLGGHPGQLAPGEILTLNLAGARPVPGNAVSAAVIDVTVPSPAPAGSLSVFPSGQLWDHRVTMSLTGGGTIQQRLTVRLGPDGAVQIRSNAYRNLNLLVDVLGFYVAGQSTQPGMFSPSSVRVLDTRGGQGPLPAGHPITVSLQPYVGIAGASAAVLDIAVLSAHSTGLLSITDGDGSQATVHVRFLGSQTAPQTMQTERVVKLGSPLSLTFSQSSASGIQLVVDLVGTFLPGQVTDAGGYVATNPRPLNAGQRIVLHGRTPTNLAASPAAPSSQVTAYNIVLSTDRPGQPTLLGLYDADAPWSGSATVSSSPWLQPSELTVAAGATDTIAVRNLFDAPETWLHSWLTGYYLHG